jgi:hypothetical protein
MDLGQEGIHEGLDDIRMTCRHQVVIDVRIREHAPSNVAMPGAENWVGEAGASYSLCGQALLLLIAK